MTTPSQNAGQHINIYDIHSSNIVLQQGDYIEVKVVWASGLRKPRTTGSPAKNQRDEFIFADVSGHIKAVVFFDEGNLNANNIREILKENTQHKITNFTIRNVERGFIGIRDQEKQLFLRPSTMHLSDVENIMIQLPQFLPYHFTKIEDIDRKPDGELIDLIGHVFDRCPQPFVAESGVQYKRIQLGSEKSLRHGIKKDIALFDLHSKAVTKKNAVYAFLNIQVSTYRDNKSLKATANTIIVQIPRDEIEILLPPEYHQEHFVTRLFPQSRTQRRATPSSSAPNAVLGFPGLSQILNPNPEHVPNEDSSSPPNSNDMRTPPRRSRHDSGSVTSSEDEETDRRRPRVDYGDAVEQVVPNNRG